jgi:hypothetical protein
MVRGGASNALATSTFFAAMVLLVRVELFAQAAVDRDVDGATACE